MAPLVSVSADLTVGISLGAEDRDGRSPAPENVSADSRPVDEWMSRFRRSAAQLRDLDIVRSVVGRFGAPHTEPDPSDEQDGQVLADQTVLEGEAVAVPKFSRFAVMNRSLDVMQATLARYQLAAYPPDVQVRVPRAACRSLDFHRATEMIELGRVLTQRALDDAGLTTTTAGASPANSDRDPA
jgi:NTE family protein